MMAFRLVEGLDIDRFYKYFAIDICFIIPKTIKNWKEKKLLKIDKNSVTLEENGLLLLNSFLCEAFVELETNFYKFHL